MESKNSTFHDEKSDLAKAIHEFLNASILSKMRQILEQHPELLSEEADSMLEAICKSAPSEGTIELVQDYRDFLAYCREVGIDQAFETILSSSGEIDDLVEIIKNFLSTSNAVDARKILEHHPELLSEEVDSMLDALSMKAPKEEIIIAIQFRRNLLARCREAGISQAFEEISSFFNETPGIDLEMILEEIANLSSPQDIPRKIMLLQYALSLICRKSNPVQWAFLQLDLVDSLGRNHQGNLGDNIEQVIRHCNQALEIFTYHDYPILWAVIQYHLANAYHDRILGERAENIEKAIEHYNQILEVLTSESFPVDWAATQNNPVNAYKDSIKGNRFENIEKAIEHYIQALIVYSQNAFPVQCAEIQNDLATVFLKRVSGHRSENLEKVIEYCNQAHKVRKLKDFPDDWAATQNILATAFWSRIYGDKAENIEHAIELLNQVLEVLTQKDFPDNWARTHNNLATAYSYRIRGNRAENIEKAIEHCNQALYVRTQKDFPAEWAITQANLASIYCERIRGDKAENIEKAIEHNNKALEVQTKKDFPDDWAETQNNLACAYWSRIRGDRAENIEKAIEYFNNALEIHTLTDFPVEWASIQNNLALAYWSRIWGDRAENIEKAIEHYDQALVVTNHQDFPVQWAIVQTNLALAYRSRIRGNRAENIEKAIEHYDKALEVRTQNDSPWDWATTHINLGAAYLSRIHGDRAENIETAVEHCNKALEVYNHTDFPVQWAIIQTNLAKAYYDRITGNRDQNIKKAIRHCHNGLEVLKLESMPYEFRNICCMMGHLFFIQGKWQNAVDFYKDAIKAGDLIYRSDLSMESKGIEIQENSYFYKNAAIASCRLGLANEALVILDRGKTRLLSETLRLKMKQPNGVPNEEWMKYEEAAKRYIVAIKPSNLSTEYLNLPHTDEEKYNIALKSSNRKKDYPKMEKEIQKTLEDMDLALMSIRKYIPEFLKELEDSEVVSLLDNETALLTFCIYNEGSIGFVVSRSKGIQSLDIPDFKTEDLNNLLFRLDELRYITDGWIVDPEFQKELEDPRNLSHLKTALHTFLLSNEGRERLEVSRSNGIQSVNIPGFRIEDVNNMLYQIDELRSMTGGWIDDYLSYLNASEIYHNYIDEYQDNLTPEVEKYLFEANKNLEIAFQTWQETLNNVLSIIGVQLLDPLMAKLPPQTKKLILLPSDGLYLLPLHAVPLSEGQLLCQRFCISYAPSISLLREMKNKARTVEGKGLYEVINPGKDPTLVFSGCEGKAISKLFQSPQINVGEIGTKPTVLHNVPRKAYLHFSCHGRYNWKDPLQSGLHLFGGRPCDILSLADLQSDTVDISSARLVTLSACETGITDILKGSADEFVGLPAGFMLAGVPCVVSSLWSVPEISTALLMEQFYFNHIVGGMDIPLALQEAQLWVRDLTSEHIAEYVEKCYQLGRWEGKSKTFIEQYREHYIKMAKESPDEKPFQHPYYWAAFTVNGA